MDGPAIWEAVSPILGLLTWLGASLLYRTLMGKPIFFQKPLAPTFYQGNASGYSHRNVITWLGRAHNCLVVQVSDDELYIHPHVPFNWLFLPEIYGLEYKVPLHKIITARVLKKWYGRRVELEFRTSGGRIEKVTLSLGDPDGFVAAVGHSEVIDGQKFVKSSGVITSKPIEPGA